MPTSQIGRPPIGAKAQTTIPFPQHATIEEEASRRAVPYAVVLREVIEVGVRELYPQAAR